jgi:hypothetical protein
MFVGAEVHLSRSSRKHIGSVDPYALKIPAPKGRNTCYRRAHPLHFTLNQHRVQFHFTPTSASWLNQIEIVFSVLQRKTLNGASFKSKDQLREAIEAFIRRHNERAKPFRWRKREVKGSQLKNTIVNLRN